MNDHDRLLGPLHRWSGILFVAVFLATGQYMDIWFDHLVGMDPVQRMLFRSTHLYILLAGIANFTLGLHFRLYEHRALRGLQVVGSVLLLAVPLLYTVGFFTEPHLTELARPFTRPATYAAFGGGLFHLASWIGDRVVTSRAL